ncbi:hypothetical protein BJ878DRAFT_161787 [Calycina marina]|uniref:Histone transcription regulator 3 homolog n=1 Tax=Calycina marina TaxID=1763456 RepID=A0A9P7Z8X0_9HELO|nr:hypothetical protein BJ878DRAFT_161787 [Calycina marina]
MANFTALNIEPDDHSDDEVDNTKELQIEEALKAYQNALRLHAQGPAAYAQAADAYKQLFQSDIFKYPESITEFMRLEEHPELEYVDLLFPLALELAVTGAEATPSTLPQILYLSFKNHGQFILDCVKSRLKQSQKDSASGLTDQALNYQAKAAIDNFASALARDESDTELWRRAARIGTVLGSRRIARYCLEAAVEVDDDPTVAEVEPPSLEEGFAGEQLKEVLNILGDEVAAGHPIMAPFMKKGMAPYVLKHIDPYKFLPNKTTTLGNRLGETAEQPQARNRLMIPEWSWTSLGDALQAATAYSPPGIAGVAVALDFPDGGPELRKVAEEIVPPQEDEVMQGVEASKSPTTETATPLSAPFTTTIDAQPTEPVTTTVIATSVPLNDERESPQEEAQDQGFPILSRKRSQSVAGICENLDDDAASTRRRGKRTRKRDNINSEVDPMAQYNEQLQIYVEADEHVFDYVGGLLSKIGVDDLGTFQSVQLALTSENGENRADLAENCALRDLRDILRSWDRLKSLTFVNASAADILGSAATGANAGLEAFLGNSKTGPLKVHKKPLLSATENLVEFAEKVEYGWLPLQDVIFDWLCVIIRTYRDYLWSEDLKSCFMRMISYVDGDIYERVQADIARTQSGVDTERDPTEHEDMVQTLFELHLDLYVRITNPNSIVSHEMRVISKDRLDRWASSAANLIRSHDADPASEIALRHMWAAVYYSTMVDDVARNYKVACWSELQTILVEAGSPTIELPNNAVMSEISATAAGQEVSQLTTIDFFYNLFQTETSKPTDIIETLEPVLDPETACAPEEEVDREATDSRPSDTTTPALRDMWKFLSTGSTLLRLFLWQRLREAYATINYNTKVFSCYLKSIEVIVEDMKSEKYIDTIDEPRRHQLLLWLKALDDLLVKALTIALNDSAGCFEIIDDRHLKTTCSALAQLNRVLHAASLFDDEIRVGKAQLPDNPEYGPHGSFNGFIGKLREMQVRAWALQYTMVKEATAQNPELFTLPEKSLADFLAVVHYCLGLRKCCKSSNKIFLKMMKVELIRFKQVEKWEDYLGQVLYDLYGMRIGVGTYLLEEHGCPPEALDRRTVLNISEQVIVLANRMPLKDLLKHELRSAIERMQTAIGQVKSTPQMQHNLRNITEFLKTSLHPLQMYRAFKGEVYVDSVPVDTADSGLADKGWYFLQGMIALTKFRTQKRLGPGGQTDDMRVAATFLRLQLQYNVDHWETWYRLAQCFDYELEDEVMWTADKINNHRPDLVRVQRGAIHCYVMAISCAVHTADERPETTAKLADLYFDFGMRVYASSREPFSMEAFWMDEFERHMSGSQGMYKMSLHEELTRWNAWRYSAACFRQALKLRPDNWLAHYMLGKVLYKLFCRANPDDYKQQATRPTVKMVLNEFEKAILTVPRDSRKEATLEPHYKMITSVHKLVLVGAIELQEAVDLLQRQPYAIRKGEAVAISTCDEWEPFILETLKHLRAQDKQHWQHRMVWRVANILFDPQSHDYTQAGAALREFRESMFTKTMHINVWKPDYERPGRHCVYMERYVRFMMNILFILNDKANMEALCKRVRKKSNDFQNFAKIWTDCCTTYLKLIRRIAEIPLNMDEAFKAVSPEEFAEISERIDIWISNPAINSPALDALREASELKKTNSNQIKPAPIDDLINDAWAVLFLEQAKKGPVKEDPSGSLTHAQLDGGIPVPVFPRPMATGPMSLNNVLEMDPQQPPLTPSLPPAEVSRPRKQNGILRREVLRRAEAAVTRLAMEHLQRLVGPREPRSVGVAPVSELVLGSNAPPTETRKNGMTDNALLDGKRKKNGNGNGSGKVSKAASRRQSLDDDADDESDLSDVPDIDDSVQDMLFPNLMRRATTEDDGGGEDKSTTTAKVS